MHINIFYDFVLFTLTTYFKKQKHKINKPHKQNYLVLTAIQAKKSILYICIFFSSDSSHRAQNSRDNLADATIRDISLQSQMSTTGSTTLAHRVRH